VSPTGRFRIHRSGHATARWGPLARTKGVRPRFVHHYFGFGDLLMTAQDISDSCDAFDDGGAEAAYFCARCGRDRESHAENPVRACSECDCSDFVGDGAAAFCSACGHSRGAHTRAMAKQVQVCRKCECTGLTGPTGTVFCSSCGHASKDHDASNLRPTEGESVPAPRLATQPQAPLRQQTTSETPNPRKKLLVISGAVAVLLVIVIIVAATSGGSDSTGSASNGGDVALNDPPAAPDYKSMYRADVDGYNSSSARGIAATGAVLGASLDCSIGTSSDFPDQTLITVISSSGMWFQFTFKGGQMLITGMRNGSDYTQGMGGVSWPDFKAQGAPCSISNDATIAVG